MGNDEVVKAYHTIITDLEAPIIAHREKVQEGKWYDILEPRYTLEYQEIVSHLEKKFPNSGKLVEELLRRGYLLPLPKDWNSGEVLGYRSLHMDVLVRSSEIRTHYQSSRYLLGTRFAIKHVSVPAHDDRIISLSPGDVSLPQHLIPIAIELRDAARRFFGDERLTEQYSKIAHEFVEHLDAYQAYSLGRLLSSPKRVQVLAAPTGSGKTEIFLLYALAWLMKRRHEDKDQHSRVI
ncbi:MAG: DEAD/DEAH box helicase family protein, partial [Infirmifilum sp.]